MELQTLMDIFNKEIIILHNGKEKIINDFFVFKFLLIFFFYRFEKM